MAINIDFLQSEKNGFSGMFYEHNMAVNAAVNSP